MQKTHFGKKLCKKSVMENYEKCAKTPFSKKKCAKSLFFFLNCAKSPLSKRQLHVNSHRAKKNVQKVYF